MTLRAVVRGVGHYLPSRVVENAEFEKSLDTTDEWIRSRSGIERRHFATEDDTTSSMATAAAQAALADAGLEPDDLDAIVLATSTADLTFPSAATMVQAQLGMTRGNQVCRHAVEKLAATAETAMERAGVSSKDVDWIVPHQANIRIIQGTARKMGIDMDRVVVSVQDHGNTSAASIPLAMSVGRANGQIKDGDLVVTEAIGGGLAWGAVVLRW